MTCVVLEEPRGIEDSHEPEWIQSSFDDEGGELLHDDRDEFFGVPGLGEVPVEPGIVDRTNRVLMAGLTGDQNGPNTAQLGVRIDRDEQVPLSPGSR